MAQKQNNRCELSRDEFDSWVARFRRENINLGRWGDHLGMLYDIVYDFYGRREDFRRIALRHLRELQCFPGVHLTRYRVKEAESFAKKLLTSYPDMRISSVAITTENYVKEIKDLIGLRAIYVVKRDAYRVHKAIMARYEPFFVHPPKLNYRVGDDLAWCKDENGEKWITERVPNENRYRSVHYVFRDNEGGFPNIELQMRSIFEEASSEIDHIYVYKGSADDHIKDVMRVLNGLSGQCDELACAIHEYSENYDRAQSMRIEQDEAKEPSGRVEPSSPLEAIQKVFLGPIGGRGGY